jgi:hypothetical protein
MMTAVVVVQPKRQKQSAEERGEPFLAGLICPHAMCEILSRADSQNM